MEENKPKHQEKEVELVPIFVWIGRGISGFFNGIGRFFAGLGHFFILFLIFLQRNLILIAGLTVLGAALGWYLNQGSTNAYTTEMRVQPNFNSTEHLTAKVFYYQSLVDEKDIAKLGKELGITSSMAASIKNISIKPYYNDIELLKEYDDFARSSDTMALKHLNFASYKGSKRDFDYEFQIITASGSNTIALNKVMDKLIALEPTTAMIAAKNIGVETTWFKLAALDTQLRGLDSLMVSLNKSVRNSSMNQTTPSNNFYLSEQQESSNVFKSLFEEKNSVLNRIEEAKKDFYNYENMINVVSRYTQKGAIEKERLILKLALIFFLFGIVVAGIPKLWKFLKAYEERNAV